MRVDESQFLSHRGWQISRPPKSVTGLPAISAAFLAASVCLSATGNLFAQATTSSSVNVQSEQVGQEKKVSPPTSQVELPDCPAADSDKPVEAQATRAAGRATSASTYAPGPHKVILSWNRSVPSQDDQGKNITYCVYRRKLPGEEKNSSDKTVTQQDLKKLELLNATSIDATSCVDAAVEDGATYKYAARAVNRKGNPSKGWSNAAKAQIPSGGQPGSTPLPTPVLPSCNGPTTK